MLSDLATLSRLQETLRRRSKSFSRAVYYHDEPEMRRLRADIQRLRKLIMIRQEFFELSPDPDVVTVRQLLERYG